MKDRRSLVRALVAPLLALVASLALPAVAAAQDDPLDVELWMAAGLDARITKLFRISSEQQVRLREDVSELDAVITEIRPWLRIEDFFRVEAGYRFIARRDGDSARLESWHRFFGGARFDLDLRQFGFDLRLRYQAQLRFEGVDAQEHTVRARLRGAWTIEDTTLLVSYELFTRLAEEDTAIAAHKWRGGVGVQHDIGPCTVGADVRYEGYFAKSRAALIFGLSFSYGWEL